MYTNSQMFPTLSIYSQILSLLVPPVDLGDLELAVCHRHLDVAGPEIDLKEFKKRENDISLLCQIRVFSRLTLMTCL